ncbi:hypothetical protein WJX74_010943 [Apatococcus lobatus]|uniref:DCD domain-containing protein n=1 Tax=Apatococcus lobatus TaxID=904363 RepID=A0AAW1RCJ7_9CHLO
MGAGRKTQTVEFNSNAAAFDFERSQRNLGLDLGGVIFGCSVETFHECVEGLIFGLPRPHMCYVQNIRPGMPVFLFNYSERRMYGIYRAVTEGTYEINPQGGRIAVPTAFYKHFCLSNPAWTSHTGGSRTRFPAQVQVEVYKACPALTEGVFKPILSNCYTSDSKLTFELKNSEAAAMCRAFDKAAAAVTPKASRASAAAAPPVDPDGWQTVTTKKPSVPSGPPRESAWASGAPSAAPSGFPTPAEAAKGITAIPDPTPPPPEPPAKPAITAERTASGASSSSTAPGAAAAQKASGPGGPMVAKPAARKPPAAAPASRDTGAAIPPPKDDREKEKEKERARAKAAAEAEKPAEPERSATSSSLQAARSPSPGPSKPARSPSPAPAKPDYNFARAGLPEENGTAGHGAPSPAGPQATPDKADPYSFALAPLPDAEPNQGYAATSEPSQAYDGSHLPTASSGQQAESYHADPSYTANGQAPQYPGQDNHYQAQVPQSAAGPGTGPSGYEPSPTAHAGMNGYHNTEAANSSPAANHSPDPGAVAEELLQVRLVLQNVDPDVAEVLTSHLARRLSEQGRLAGTIQSLQEDNQRLSGEVAELKVAMSYLASSLQPGYQQHQLPQQLPDAGHQPSGAYPETSHAPQGPHTAGQVPDAGGLGGDQELWLLGGNAGTHWMDSIDIFQPADGSWRAGPTMPSVRGYGEAAILGRQLFVAGGGDGTNWLSSVLRLSLDDGTWSEAGSMQYERGSHALVALPNEGVLWALGGGQPQSQLDKVEVYHPYQDQWFDGPHLPCPRFATAAAYLHGCIYMLGGFDGRQYLSSVIRCDPREGEWHPVADMIQKRGSHACTVWKDYILAAGGWDGKFLPTVEVWDPRKGGWGPVAPMQAPRAYGATANVDGQVYSVGGMRGETHNDSLERYDFDTRSWQALDISGSLSSKRAFPAYCVVDPVR